MNARPQVNAADEDAAYDEGLPPRVYGPVSPPPVTDEQLRAAGLTPAARQFPRSEAGARWIARFNGARFENIPAAWWYASNAYMLRYVEDRA